MEGYADPEGMWEQVLDALKEVEKVMGRKIGDLQKPLLVSCRSGAKFSMPGMMDTVLNIGMNDAVAASLAKTHGSDAADQLYVSFIKSYAVDVLRIDADMFDGPMTPRV